MAIYEPIRDSFREFNRMLIDAKTWDEQHAKTAANQQYQHAVLRSNLQQQAFQNEMSKQTMAMRERGQQLDADRFTNMVAEQTYQHNLDTAKASMAEKIFQQGERRLANTIATGQTQRAEIKQMMKIRNEPYEKVPVDLSPFIPPHFATHGEFMTRVNEMTGILGMSVDTDLMGRVYGGEVAKMAPVEMQKYVPGIQGLVAEFNDPDQNIKTNIDNLTDQETKLKGIIKNVVGPYGVRERGLAKRELQLTQKEIVTQYSLMKPVNKHKAYMQQYLQLSKSAAWARGKGLNDTAKAWESQAFEFLEKATAAEATSKGQQIPLYKKELDKDGKVQSANFRVILDTTSGMFNWPDEEGNTVVSPRLPEGTTDVKPTETFGKGRGQGVDAEGNTKGAIFKGHALTRSTITPQLSLIKATEGQNAAAEMGQKFYTNLIDEFQTPDKNGNIKPITELRAIQAKNRAIELLEKVHNKLASRYEAAVKNYGEGSDALDQWVEEIYLPLVQEQGFTYAPIEKYRQEIRGTE